MRSNRNRSRKNSRRKVRRQGGNRSLNAQFRSLSTPIDATTEILKCDPLLLVINSGGSTFTGTPYFTFDATSDLTAISTTRLNTYSEFRFVKIVAHITPLLYSAAGSSAFAFVPQNGLSSSATIDQYPQSRLIPNASAGSRKHTLSWVARTTSELNFNDTPAGPSIAPVVFGAYTDQTNYGTSNSTGANQTYFRVDFYVTCQMRGLYIS